MENIFKELKNCPFCGGEAYVCTAKRASCRNTVPYDMGYYVQCSTCGHKTNEVVTTGGQTCMQAIRRIIVSWNSRVNEDNRDENIETSKNTTRIRVWRTAAK